MKTPSDVLQDDVALLQLRGIFEASLQQERPLEQEGQLALEHADGLDLVVVAHADLEVLLQVEQRDAGPHDLGLQLGLVLLQRVDAAVFVQVEEEAHLLEEALAGKGESTW